MISFFRKLRQSNSGNALVIGAACLPMIVGCAGLASDTIQWTLWRRQLQRAADSAAIAGVYDRESANGATTNTSSAVSHDLTLNQHTWMTLSASPVVNFDASCPVTSATAMTNRVCVTLSVQQRLPFSSMFMTAAPTINATATAASISYGGNACFQALVSTAITGINNSGNTTINAPTCIMYSNSPSANSASAGGSSSVTAKAIAGVGGIAQSNNWHVQQYLPYSPALADPFANVTPNPANMNCTASALTNTTNLNSLGGKNCFSSLSVGPNKTLDLTGSPLNGGPVYINAGSVDLKGTFKCTCTIVLTNTSTATNATIGTFSSNAQASNIITAPTTGPFAGIAVYQDRRATGGTDKINGGSSSMIQGAMYFPKDQLWINGSGSANAMCAMFIGWTLTFTGNSGISVLPSNDPSCAAAGLPNSAASRIIRLVA
jgi:hypothetical protein